MRRLLLIGVAALALPAAAPGKIEGDLRVCGPSVCRTIDRHEGHEAWPLVHALFEGLREGPARPGPFYRLEVVPRGSRSTTPSVGSLLWYYVPAAGVVRGTGGAEARWQQLADAERARLAPATRGVRPFPAPRLVRVEVDGRIARDPHSYLRLFRLPAPSRPVRDPAGLYPPVLDDRGATDDTELASYFERVRRHWLPVNMWSRTPTPWTDGDSFVWVGRTRDLVKRDGEIVRVPHELAVRIRRGVSLR